MFKIKLNEQVWTFNTQIDITSLQSCQQVIIQENRRWPTSIENNDDVAKFESII